MHLAAVAVQPKGLINTGNSCFLNAVLQSLTSCPKFMTHLQVLSTTLENRSKSNSNRKKRGTFSYNLFQTLSTLRVTDSKRLPLSKASSTMNPSMIMDYLRTVNPNFTGETQEDALGK